MEALIGVCIGLLIFILIIRPIQKKYYHDICIKEGLAPNKQEVNRNEEERKESC